MKWGFRLLLLLVFVSSGYCLQLSDLITQTRIFLRDTATDPTRQRFSDAQITSFLNNGQKETNLKTWAVISSTAVSLVTGTTEYSLPNDMVAVVRVTVNNVPVVERTFSFLDESNSSWMSDTGTVTEYYIREDSSVVAGVARECIGTHPITTMTAVMMIQYLAQPADLAVNTDVPFSGLIRFYPYHQALAYYATWRGDMAVSNLEEARTYLQEYMAMVDLMESTSKNRLEFNPSFRGNSLLIQQVQQSAQPAQQQGAK